MIFAYLRVSSREQNLDRQFEAVKEYEKTHGIKVDRYYKDKKSGKNFERPQYQAMKGSLREGDTLIIKELDRLGRNMEQIKKEWFEIQELGVGIIVIDTPILNTEQKTDLEKALISNIVFELLSYMAEKERLKTRQRQEEGIAAAKKLGKHLGRPKFELPEQWPDVYKKWKNREIRSVDAMRELGMSKTSFYRAVAEGKRE